MLEVVYLISTDYWWVLKIFQNKSDKSDKFKVRVQMLNKLGESILYLLISNFWWLTSIFIVFGISIRTVVCFILFAFFMGWLCSIFLDYGWRNVQYVEQVLWSCTKSHFLDVLFIVLVVQGYHIYKTEGGKILITKNFIYDKKYQIVKLVKLTHKIHYSG